MEHLALYRKYRPATFEEVIGQDHVVKVIKKSIKEGSFSHAYLLTGSRGIGKTTIARIIASELGASREDIYEMDAASNRGIDDIRELKENVHTLPFNGKYKVYIIDEVHMLTKEAFNSLLKTLEEPPSHVIFILATTELHKVPETIVSRCQNFKFNKPTDAILRDVVVDIAKKEGYELDADGADIVAMLGDGSFRDTLVTLQKVLSYAKNKKIKSKDVEDITGAPERRLVHEFIDALVDKDINRGFKTIESIGKEGIDVRLFLKMVLHTMRLGLLVRYAPDMRKKIEEDLSENEYEYLKNLINEKNGVLSSGTLAILLYSYQTLGHAFIKELPLEIAFLKIVEK